MKHGRFFYSKARDCACCPMRGDCLSKGRVNKAVVVGDDYPLCSGLDGAATDGATKIDGCISGIVGGRKVSMARQSPGTVLRALSGAASRTCAFKPI
jgi:hypothetical protein